jgi:hypothetical protein
VASSEEALERLLDGTADLAIVQEDRLAVFAEALRLREPGAALPGVVQRLAHRHLHVLVRQPLHLEAMADLGGLRVALGPDRDGRRSLDDFLERLGLPVHRRSASACTREFAAAFSWRRLRACFAAADLDIALLWAAADDPRVAALRATRLVRTASLDYRTVRLLRGRGVEDGALRFASLVETTPGPHGDEREVQTLAVPLDLVARPGLDAAWSRRAAAAFAPLAVEAGGSANLLSGVPLSESSLPLARWHRDQDDGAEGAGWMVLSLLPVLAVLTLGLVFVFRSRRPLARRLRESRSLLAAVVGLPVGVVVVTLVTYFAEHRYNEHFSSPAESLWSITVYLFSGLEDRSPYTLVGKAGSAFGLLLGPILFTLATGWAASHFVRWERKMPGNLRDHYLLLNWNQRGLEAVRQIHHPVTVEAVGTGVVVVLSDDPDVPRRLKASGMGDDPFFEDLYVSVGDPTQERALLNANAQDAHALLVLADERQGEHADEGTLRSLFMLRKIARDHGRGDLHVVAELVNPANDVVCRQLSDDFPGLLEAVAHGEIRSCLLAQATLNPGAVAFYRDLLTVSAETNELYVVPLPEAAAGMSFSEYGALVLAARDGRAPLVPVGVQRGEGGGGRLVCNPLPGDAAATLQPGDRLVVLAYEPPDPQDLPVPAV